MKHVHATDLGNMLRDQKLSEEAKNMEKVRRNLADFTTSFAPEPEETKLQRFLNYLTYDLSILWPIGVFISIAIGMMIAAHYAPTN